MCVHGMHVCVCVRAVLCPMQAFPLLLDIKHAAPRTTTPIAAQCKLMHAMLHTARPCLLLLEVGHAATGHGRQA